jgi:acyl-CoA synthetase (AMP-forming)/AMP-acid ligase II
VNNTVIEALESAAKQHGARVALKSKRSGAWSEITWSAYRDSVRLVGRALIRLGVEPGKGVAIVGFNSPEWVIADLAAIYAGAMPAGIYTTNSPEQCRYVAHHCEAAVAFAENAEQAAKFVKLRDELPLLKRVIQWSGTPVATEGDWVIGWEALLEIGRSVAEAELDARAAAQKPDDPCTLIYTSGTTGDPKAVMITHRNLTFMASVLCTTLDFTRDEHIISYLPLSHVAEQVVSIHAPIEGAACVWFAESIDKLGDNLREVRPTVFFAVPRVWEKIQAKMAAAGAQAPPLRKKIAAWARKQGLAGGFAEQDGKAKPMFYGLANKLVFKTVRERLGLDRCKVAATSAAPISRATLEFFLSLGLPVCEVYGMSECTGPTTLSTPARYRTGKVGWVLPGTELKIESDGEICMRGPHIFKGYYKDQNATTEALDAEGWLHSGDIGTLDEAGYVQITDRKKELIITAGGENVAPQLIEGMLKSIPVIAQAVAIGDRMKYMTALVTLDPERVVEEAKLAGSPARSVAEAATCAVFKRHLDAQVAKVNDKLARVQSVKKIAILPAELTIEGGELTPTMKLRRRVINVKYKEEIAGLYAGAEA